MGKLFSGAEIVFKVLEHHKVEHIFGYPGGAVLPIYDELKNHKTIKHFWLGTSKVQDMPQKVMHDLQVNLV